MYNILIVSDTIDPFSELESHLKKDFINVSYKLTNEIERSLHDFQYYDYILFHLLPVFSDNEPVIKKMKEYIHCPLNAFAKTLHFEEQKRLYDIGCEGFYRIPFNAELVSLKIKSVLKFLKRAKQHKPDVVHIGRLTLHHNNREVHFDGKPINLTNVEFKIMQMLVDQHDVVVSKDRIIHHVWDQDVSATDNALGIHITRLRKKITCDGNPNLIETVWGLGYRLNMKMCDKK